MFERVLQVFNNILFPEETEQCNFPDNCFHPLRKRKTAFPSSLGFSNSSPRPPPLLVPPFPSMSLMVGHTVNSSTSMETTSDAEATTTSDGMVKTPTVEVKSIPVFSLCELNAVCDTAKKVFSNESTVLTLTGDFIVVGDLHGHIFDLYRLFKQYGFPPKQKYLFLGDVVDRGDFSLTVVTLIFALKSKYPDYIYQIRGNHEFENVCSCSGFHKEITRVYGENDDSKNLFFEFVSVFAVLPLVAVVNGDTICVHGGIGPKFQNLDQSTMIARPINSLYGGIADEILWSDPSDDIDLFRTSKRGIGFIFGREAVKNFLNTNNMRLMIRAHQPAQEGYEYSLDGQVLTVFSASNYCGEMNNSSGVVILKPNQIEECVRFDPLPFLTVNDVTIVLSEERDVEVTVTSARTKKQAAECNKPVRFHRGRQSMPYICRSPTANCSKIAGTSSTPSAADEIGAALAGGFKKNEFSLKPKRLSIINKKMQIG